MVEAGDFVGLVGDTGNAKGARPTCTSRSTPTVARVNPYPLLKVVDELRLQAKPREQQRSAWTGRLAGGSVSRPTCSRGSRTSSGTPRGSTSCRGRGGGPHPDDVGPAWSVDLRGRLGPSPAPSGSGWCERSTRPRPRPLRARRARRPSALRRGSRRDRRRRPRPEHVTMRLHYGGRLWVPALDRLLAEEIERSRPRLLRSVWATDRGWYRDPGPSCRPMVGEREVGILVVAYNAATTSHGPRADPAPNSRPRSRGPRERRPLRRRHLRGRV